MYLNVFLAAVAVVMSSAVCASEISTAQKLQETLIHHAETVSPAVVSIRISKHYEVTDDWLRRHPVDVSFLGSGVIISDTGCVLTNDHVVDGADQIQVVLPDGREFDAEVKGHDPALDIALLRMKGVENESLPTARLGDSDQVRLGQIVLAMGNPYGSETYLDSPQPTITMGIVSALNRSFPSQDQRRVYGNLIQTDAAINRGNSGGPLIDLNGTIIGVNVAIFSTSAGSQGIGFAIPINKVKKRLEQLRSGEKIRYGFLGVELLTLDKRVARQLGIDTVRGVMVAGVMPDYAAGQAGLQVKDIVVAVDGTKITNSTQLINLVKFTDPGTEINMTLLRDGKRLSVPVTISAYPGE